MVKPHAPDSPKSNNSSPRRQRYHRYIYTSSSNPIEYDNISLSIINGLALEFIDPVLYPELRIFLYGKMNELKAENNVSALGVVINAIEYIHNHFYKIEKRKAMKEQRKLNSFTEEDVDRAMTDLLNDKEPEIKCRRFFDSLSKKLKELKNYSIKHNDTFTTSRCKYALRYLYDFEVLKIFQNIKQEIKNGYISKVNKSKLHLKRIRRIWTSKITVQENDKEKALRAICDEKERVLSRFVIKTKKELKKPEKYIPSSKVVDLRRKEEYLRNLHRFREFHDLKDERIKLEMFEKELQEKRRKQSYKRRYKELENKYDVKAKVKSDHYDRQLQRMKNTAVSEIIQAERCLDFWQQKEKNDMIQIDKFSPELRVPSAWSNYERSLKNESLSVTQPNINYTTTSYPNSYSPRGKFQKQRRPKTPKSSSGPSSPRSNSFNYVFYSKANNFGRLRF